MDEIFLRELIIFAAILAVFVGTVPMMIKGHYAQSVEDAVGAADTSDGAGSGATRGKSKRQKARDRDAGKGAEA
jgi:hypothetical protein